MRYARLLVGLGLAGAALLLPPAPGWALGERPGAASPSAEDRLEPVTLIDQRERQVSLPDGRIWLVTFFYGQCPDVCPLLLYNMIAVKEALPPALRERVAFGAISFDPARDTTKFLAEHAENYDLKSPNDYLFTGDPETLKKTFKAFQFDFKADRNGGYQHVNLLAVMDGQGRILRHYYGLKPDTQQVAGQLKALLQK